MHVSARDDRQPSESALAVLGALEVDPRGSWAHLGDALGMSASTVARHWCAISRSRAAWITVAPGPTFITAASTAFVLMAVAPQHRQRVLRVLRADPVAATISILEGHWYVLIDCFAATPCHLDAAVERFASLDGVQDIDVMHATAVGRDGSQWRSGTITAVQRSRLGATSPRALPPGDRLDAADRMLLGALTYDGRASWSALSTVCDVSPQTARRRLARLLDGGYVELRCDSTLHARGLRRELTVLLNVPLGSVDDVIGRLLRHPGCRLVAEVLGRQNLLVTLWVRDSMRLAHLERDLGQIAPEATLTAHLVNRRTVKRLGHLLDGSGRWTETVPLDMWPRPDKLRTG